MALATMPEVKENSEPDAENEVLFPLAVPAIALTSVFPTIAPPQASPFSKMAILTVAPFDDAPSQYPSAVFTTEVLLPPPSTTASTQYRNRAGDQAQFKFHFLSFI